MIPENHRATNTRLWRAIRDRALPRELLICGPAGTGKTYGVLNVLHVLARDNPGLRILIARQTRAALTESVLVTYEQEILPLDGMEGIAAGVLRRVRQAYRYPNGSEIVLGGLDNPARVLSTAWDVVFINEAIEGQEEAWETLLSRLNRPGRSSRFGYLIGDTNPGDPSHWLRKRIDEKRLLAEWVVPHQANPRLHDGRDWTAEGHRYLSSLDQTLTGPRRKRLLQGLWAAGEGAWFSSFDQDRHVTPLAEFDPAFPARLAIDCNGLHVAAVWWQERPGPSVSVFGDYLAVDVPAESNAAAILARTNELCGGAVARVVADPAGKQRQGLNTTVFAEYQRSGLPLTPWPSFPGSVVVGLDLIESFLPSFTVHPRCGHLIAALGNYMRDQRNGQWVDVPKDPQHPHEDLIDALRGGLMDRWPEGRKPDVKLPRINPARVF